MDDTTKRYLTELSDLALRLHKDAAKATSDDKNVDSAQRALENFLAFIERARTETANPARFRFAHVAWPESTFREIHIPPQLSAASPGVLASFLTAMRQASGTSESEANPIPQK